MSGPTMLETYASVLIETGELMRDAQKRYFKARRTREHQLANAVLLESKRLEKEFDALLVSARTQLEAKP